MELFTPVSIGSLAVANRIVRAATLECLCPDPHRADERYLRLHEGLARGGAGLLVTGSVWVHPLGMAQPGMLIADRDAIVGELARVGEAVHRAGSRIFAQLNHGGRYCRPSLIGQQPLAPSAVREMINGIVPRPMTEAEVAGTIDSFVSAARRVRDAGFDGVEINAAHGNLVSQFLSPRTNRRRDRWGGSAASRSRFLEQIVAGMRAALGRAFPIAVKLNGSDCAPGGIELAESVELACRLEALGVDALTVSGGIKERGFTSSRGEMPRDLLLRGRRGLDRLRAWAFLPVLRRFSRFEEGYFLAEAAAVKRAVGIPVIAIGGLRSASVMERAIREGAADLVALSRPLVREPDLPGRLRSRAATASSCLNCNRCSASTILHYEPLACHRMAVPS